MTQCLEVETPREAVAAGMMAGAVGYAARLASVLGDGSKWEYRGEVADCGAPVGKCACGHAGLRYLFTIHHIDQPGRSVEVGSTCIGTYPGINPALVASLEARLKELQAAARAREQAAKKAAESVEVQSLMGQWSELEYRIDEIAQDWRDRHDYGTFAPYPVYNRPCAAERLADKPLGKLHRFCRLPALKTAKGQIGRLKSKIIDAERKLAEIRQHCPAPSSYF